MNAKPINFSTVEVRALLYGCKTQTRWVIKPQPYTNADRALKKWSWNKPLKGRGHSTYCAASDDELSKVCQEHSPIQPDDILWVRETWAKISDWTDGDPGVGLPDGYIYKADWKDVEHPRWRPSIYMPRETARIFLRVTDVRVERLQDITYVDVSAELGSEFPEMSDEYIRRGIKRNQLKLFHRLWNDTYAKRGYGWDTNPWVWTYTFERCNEKGAIGKGGAE